MHVPAITTKIRIFSISGDPMYLIESTPNQSHQANIDSLRELLDTKMVFQSTAPSGLYIPTPPPKTLEQILASITTATTLQTLLFIPPPL